MNRAPISARASSLAAALVSGCLGAGALACGGPSVGVASPSAASVVAAPEAPVEKTAEKAGAAHAAPASAPAPAKESLDPLSVGGDLEAAAVPKIVQTPAKELRPKSRADLEAAMALLKRETTLEGAAKKVTARLGKPTWIEGDKKRVWIAKDGKSCHRFVLDADGQADIETASTSEWRMLTALAKQSACTGEIKRGSLGD
jgi:hypothetical protein